MLESTRLDGCVDGSGTAHPRRKAPPEEQRYWMNPPAFCCSMSTIAKRTNFASVCPRWMSTMKTLPFFQNFLATGELAKKRSKSMDALDPANPKMLLGFHFITVPSRMKFVTRKLICHHFQSQIRTDSAHLHRCRTSRSCSINQHKKNTNIRYSVI